MAAAFLCDYSTLNEVVSAGKNPLKSIDSMLVTIMKECLIDLDGYVPQDVQTINVSDFDRVYACPDLPVPATMEEYRVLRDYIKNEAYLFFRKL
jgi:protein-tyrosine-phosphatase